MAGEILEFRGGEWVPSDKVSGGSGTDTLLGGTFSVPRSANIGGVDQRLVSAARQAAAPFGYNVEVTPSGGHNNRRGGTPNHPGGWALDFTLVDPNTGERLNNYQDPSTFRAYEQYAQAIKGVVDQQYPELSNVIRFGGYFGGKWGFDQMHVDVTPGAEGAMSRGSWEYGLGQDSQGNPIKLPGKWRNVASVGMLEGPQPIVQAARLAPPPDSPALGARLAAGDEAPPSYPSVQETASLLADMGYTGPDAVMRFQADNMGLAGEGGRTGPEFFAALTNPTLLGGLNITPPERPGWARGVDASTAPNAPPPITQAARTNPQANDVDLMTMTDEAGNYLDPGATIPNPPPRPAGAPTAAAPPAEGRAPPTPRTRPAGLEAANSGAVAPEGYRRLRLGSRGDDVRDVQAQLLAAGFDPGRLDGAYGPKTAAAVMAYQKAREAESPGAVGGKVDAIAGPFTQADLFNLTNNSALGTLQDPGGRPGRTPGSLDVGRLGWGREFEPRDWSDFGGGPRPGTVPAGDRPFTGKPLSFDGYDGEPFNTDPYPKELLDNIREGAPTPGVRMIETRPGPIAPRMERPFVAKPWGAEFLNTDPMTPEETAHLNSPAPKVGVTVEPGGSRTPAPLSPTAMIQSLGGTGSSGLGAAGPGGPGPSSGFGGSDDDDDTTTGPGGYNESFSTTGWI